MWESQFILLAEVQSGYYTSQKRGNATSAIEQLVGVHTILSILTLSIHIVGTALASANS